MSSEKKPPVPTPRVEVVRRPSGAPAPQPSLRPSVSPRPGPPASGAPSAGPPAGGPPKRSFPRGPPRPPPTLDQINDLAKRERVPARIAKGDLEGKMKSRIWKKLHAEEAKRFDQAYTLMEKHPELDLQDAFGVVQSGKTPAEFLARKARGLVKAGIKEARGALPGDAIDSWLAARREAKDELCLVLGDRTLVDRVVEVQPVALMLERGGRVEKLQVVLAMRKDQWEPLVGTLERDPKLTRKPVAVQRQPDRRPVADPRGFLPHVGQPLRVELRNGITLNLPLVGVGPFDVLLGEPGSEIFVPLHAMLRWEAKAA